jgi:hypothetical protein
MLTALPNVGVVASPRFNTPRGWFDAFHEGMKHFPNDPLLSTYKKRLSFSHSTTTHKRAQEHQKARAKASLHGLKP